jgi:tetratricopeptide repeat protein
MTVDGDWEARSAELWSLLDELEPEEFRARVDALAGELRDDDPVALFERGCANDSTGRPDVAVPLYAAALEAGLTGIQRRRSVIQMASSIRNLGRPEESVALLRAERERASDELDDAVVATLALALADTGRPQEAAGLAVMALAKHLPRYNRSMTAYGQELTEREA